MKTEFIWELNGNEYTFELDFDIDVGITLEWLEVLVAGEWEEANWLIDGNVTELLEVVEKAIQEPEEMQWLRFPGE